MKYEYELAAAGHKLFHDLFRLQPGEVVAITMDTTSSDAVANAMAQAAHLLGGKPFIYKQATPRGFGKTGDQDMALKSLIGALKNADVWVELNEQWLLYSTVYDVVIHEDPENRPRYLMLGGLTPDMFIRDIGKVDFPVLAEFLNKMAEATYAAKDFHFTTPAGSDLYFTNYPDRRGGIADGQLHEKNKKAMMPGQISWTPEHSSIHGVIVVDGSMTPPVGLLQSPIRLAIEKGRIVDISGDGREAKLLADWFESFHWPDMYGCAHLCYGFHPHAVLNGNIIEDERVWGCIEWGFGNMSPKLGLPKGIPCPSHTDGICLNASLWMDGVQVLDKGTVVGPTEEIVALSRKLKP